MNKEQAYAELLKIAGEELVRTDEPMSLHTTFRIGGPADIFITPENTGMLAELTAVCRENGIPYAIMGKGSNLLVRDKGIRGVVINTSERMKHYSVTDTEIDAEAGCQLSAIANAAMENGLTGFEFASGIPGSMGGATAMNAGAYGGQMDMVVSRTEVLDESGRIFIQDKSKLEFGYRESIFQKNDWTVLKTVIKLNKGNRDEIKALMDDLNSKRREKQPLNLPSAGSTFRRAPGYFTGKLIEENGLKGYRIGGAQISEKHGGFIVNLGGATAADVLNLIEHVRGVILKNSGVELVPEVKVIGEI